MTTGTFHFEWANPGSTSADSTGFLGAMPSVLRPPRIGHPKITSRETEIFVPHLITQNKKLVVHGLGAEDSHHYDETRQTLFVVTSDTTPGKIHKISVSLDPPLRPAFPINTFWGDFGPRIFTVSVGLIGVLAYWGFRLRGSNLVLP